VGSEDCTPWTATPIT
nr:tetrameric alpha-amylase inhibitor 16 kDa subunit, CMb* [Hordeum vulgare L.=barley, cv. Bomi, Peptide Partial, 15 aa] [Hordeum vulgare]